MKNGTKEETRLGKMLQANQDEGLGIRGHLCIVLAVSIQNVMCVGVCMKNGWV